MTLSLTEVQRGLGLFAEGLSGQPMQLEVLEDHRFGWPWDLSLPEPGVIRLAQELPIIVDAREHRLIHRTQVLHQVAMVEFGTFEFGVDSGDATPPSRHPVIVDSEYADVAASLVVMLEHLRISAAVARRYPGASADLAAVLGVAYVELLAEGRIGSGIVGALHLLAIGQAPETVRRCCPGIDSITLDRLVAIVDPLRDQEATLATSAHAAVRIAELLAELSVGETSEPDGEGMPPTLVEPDEDAEFDPEAEELGGISTSPPPLDAEADQENDDLVGAVQVGPISLAEELTDLDNATEPARRSPPRTEPIDLGLQARTFLYDEWNYGTGDYHRAWCRVVERHLQGDDHEFIGGVRRRHRDLERRIRRQFALLRPEDRIRVHKRNDGEELDLDAVIEAIVDRRSGTFADDRIDLRRDRARREVATAFLVDLSASTSSPVEEPAAPPAEVLDPDDFILYPGFAADAVTSAEPVRRVIDAAKDAVALMCDALHRLGDQHAVYGFSGQSRHDIEFHIGKDFDDATSPSSWAALGAMEPIGYTRMGPAIRHGASKLSARDARTKLLIVISDGYPQDVDYGPDRRDKQYGVHDTARAIAEASAMGVDTFCVTIDPAGHDYLRVMCPDQRYLVIDDVETLPSELAKLYLGLAAPTRNHTRPNK